MSIKLTIGMAHHTDFDGVYFTIQALRMYHDLRDTEIIIIDNSPDNNHGRDVKGFSDYVRASMPCKYIPFTESSGTTQTRQRIFDEASGEIVLVMDCHVLLIPNAIARLKAYLPGRSDIFSGPLLLDHFGNMNTHFDLKWREQMWGIWATAWRAPDGSLVSTEDRNGRLGLRHLNSNVDHPQQLNVPWNGHEASLVNNGYKWAAADDNDPPFEIPAQGLGVFASCRDTWLGFNRDFRLFGGEEGYIHEKYRRAGRKAICLPFLKWVHRFGRPNGQPYQNSVAGKIRNYLLGFQELGMCTDSIKHHFVDEVKFPLTEFERIAADPKHYQPTDIQVQVKPASPMPEHQTSNLGHPLPPMDALLSFESLAQWVAQQPRDLHEHGATLMELSSKCDHVTEMTERRESSAFLLGGAPRTLISYTSENDTLFDLIKGVTFKKESRPVAWTLHVGPINEPPPTVEETDMLFLDIEHTGKRLKAELDLYHPLVKKFIVIHDTELYGAVGADRSTYGLHAALKDFLREHPEWVIIDHIKALYGLTVLSPIPEYRPAKAIRAWPKNCGPGTELKSMLKMVGIEATPDCSCTARAHMMDDEGVDWCRSNIDTIVEWLREEAAKRGLPFVDLPTRLMVKRAINVAARKEKKGLCPDLGV